MAPWEDEGASVQAEARPLSLTSIAPKRLCHALGISTYHMLEDLVHLFQRTLEPCWRESLVAQEPFR
jgi:hypothetical protein